MTIDICVCVCTHAEIKAVISPPIFFFFLFGGNSSPCESRNKQPNVVVGEPAERASVLEGKEGGGKGHKAFVSFFRSCAAEQKGFPALIYFFFFSSSSV